MTQLGPITLEGRHVRLEPLRPHHLADLLTAGNFAEIWTWKPHRLMDRAAMEAYIADAMAHEVRGSEYTFAVIHKESGQAVGSTRYLDVTPAHRGVEIGSTWYTPSVWSTQVNPECKYLLLRHAFEEWGALRVQIKTDHMNTRSQAAIRKLGAQYEGTLRNHRIRPDGSIRDTVYFSIVDREWPEVRARLLARLGQ